MKHALRDYQEAAVNHAVGQLQRGEFRTLYTSPTGSGKSLMELAVQARLRRCFIVTPRIEIAAGMLDKLGVRVPDSEPALYALADMHRIFTPVRLKNLLLSGELAPPDYLVIDEAHHDTASVWQSLHLLSACPAVGFTATGFRGTPQGTAELRKQWGEPVPVLTYPEAVSLGVIAFPACETQPFVDDDTIELVGGEFAVASIEGAYRDRLRDIAAKYAPLASTGVWDLPTMFAVPSRKLAGEIVDALRSAGSPAVEVTGETPHSERQAAFRACLDRSAALVQIAVVSEGVDLAVRRLVDCSPTLSPVLWLQRFGRITRPGGNSQYVCTNRNLMRHGYLLDGLLPPSAIKQAEEAFRGPSKRLGHRAIGLEALGKLKAAELPLAGGITGTMYTVTETRGHESTVYCALLHPARTEIVWAKREDSGKGGERTYGKWVRTDPPADLKGFASVSPSPISEKQLTWWKRCAKRHGLNPEVIPTKKNFQALAVLSDLRIRL